MPFPNGGDHKGVQPMATLLVPSQSDLNRSRSDTYYKYDDSKRSRRHRKPSHMPINEEGSEHEGTGKKNVDDPPVYFIEVPDFSSAGKSNRSFSDSALLKKPYPSYKSINRDDDVPILPNQGSSKTRTQWTDSMGRKADAIIDSATTTTYVPVKYDSNLPESGDDFTSSQDQLEKNNDVSPPPSETWYSTSCQVFFPFLLAGMGSVGASILLDFVKNWQVFNDFRELFILIPPLLGLNGNLEMTLVARLSTQANLGNLDTFGEQIRMVGGNMALLQCQSTVVAFVACCLAMIKGVISNDEFTFMHAAMLCASGIVAANLASMILSTLMSSVVILSRKCKINPDNVAAPIAASMGDLTTLALLSGVSSKFYAWKNTRWMTPAVFLACLLLLPVWFYLARRNSLTKTVLYVGWIPILSAVVISSFGGYILDFSVVRFEGIALHLSAVNAVGGNLAAIFCCRLSTYLNKRCDRGVLPACDSKRCVGFLETFFGGTENTRTARILLLIVIPGQIIFVTITDLLRFGHFTITVLFGGLYVLVAVLQVGILLILSRILVFWLWWWKIDPDNAAIPFITAAGDFTGTGLLTCAFFLLEMARDPVALQ